jgi:8-amino-7-oxononanoate synthase
MTRWSEWLASEAAAREAAGLQRRLRPRPAEGATTDLAGNDYLGLSRDPAVAEAAAAAARRWGAGAGASRLVTGTLELHAQLERELSAYLGQPAALVFSTGYHANLAAVAGLGGRDVLVVSDAHVHASLVDAVRLSKATVEIAPHQDVVAVEAALAGAGDRRTLVLAESVYSVLGDEAPLAALAEVCERYDALLVVDEAHGIGVRGPGVVRELGLAGLPHVLVTATLSKALGSQGGAVLGPQAVVDHLVNRARPFIFDTGLAPAAAGAALEALRQLRARPELADVVRRRSADLAAALGVDPPAGAVLSVPMPSPLVALAAQASALAQGVTVGCFRPPSVPDGVSRLRITVSSGIPDADWSRAVDVLVAVVKEHSSTPRNRAVAGLRPDEARFRGDPGEAL